MLRISFIEHSKADTKRLDFCALFKGTQQRCVVHSYMEKEISFLPERESFARHTEKGEKRVGCPKLRDTGAQMEVPAPAPNGPLAPLETFFR